MLERIALEAGSTFPLRRSDRPALQFRGRQRWRARLVV